MRRSTLAGFFGSQITRTYLDVINDTNTFGWYDYNDSIAGVIKDGSNRASVWLDKKNYTVGAELLSQSLWYTMAYWNIVGAGWSQVGVTANTTAAGNSNITKNAFWNIGSLYKISITVTVSAGTFYPLYDGNIPPMTINASGTYDYYYVPTATILRMSGLNNHNVTVTAVSIKEITGKHLLQATSASQPIWSSNGILFDGVNDFMKATAFALAQPEFIYMVIKPVSFTTYDTWFDGNTNNSGNVLFGLANPIIYAAAPTASPNNDNVQIGNYHILRVLYNGGLSKLIVNNTTPTTWNCGTSNMGGFTLGKIGTASLYFANIEVKEIIGRKVSDSLADEKLLYNYLAIKYGFSTI